MATQSITQNYPEPRMLEERSDTTELQDSTNWKETALTIDRLKTILCGIAMAIGVILSAAATGFILGPAVAIATAVIAFVAITAMFIAIQLDTDRPFSLENVRPYSDIR